MTTTRPILLGFAVPSVALILAMICVDGLRSGTAWQAAAALALMGAVVGSAVVGAVASRRAARSIRQVTQGIDRIAAGDLGYRVDVPPHARHASSCPPSTTWALHLPARCETWPQSGTSCRPSSIPCRTEYKEDVREAIDSCRPSSIPCRTEWSSSIPEKR